MCKDGQTIASGTCGSAKWEIGQDGSLLVHDGTLASGNGTAESWPWHPYCERILMVSFEDAIAGKSVACLLDGCKHLTSVSLAGLDTGHVTSMRNMFNGCHSLGAIDLSCNDTHGVTDMAFLFADCYALSSVVMLPHGEGKPDGGNATTSSHVPFGTESVEDMTGMFFGCRSLATIDLSPLDTSRVTSMRAMFEACFALSSIDLSPLDTHSVTDMECMFYDTGLVSVDVSTMDTSNVTCMHGMFNF